METIYIREASVKYKTPRKIPARLSGPEQAAVFVRKLIGNDAREHFIVVMFDGQHRPIAYQIVSIGTAIASLVHPREVFQAAVGIGACGLIIAHNHPSGMVEPSSEDNEVAERLRKAGEVVGIKIIDFLVVTDKSYYSSEEEKK